jgi:predicted alpha/beta hydrolase
MTKGDWLEYVQICGWTLARAHARTGDAALIGGYLGKNDTFDCALAEFGVSYADQTERDYAILIKAIRARQLKAQDTSAA